VTRALLVATWLAALCRPVPAQAAAHDGRAPSAGAATRLTTPAPDAAACRARRDDMRRALLATHERQKNVGLGAAVLLGGTFVLSEGLGHADLEHRVPVTRDTRFGVASVTKAFTGAALLALHERGRLDLDAPIQRYVPAFPAKPGGAITPRLLAGHRAGLRHWRDDERTPALYARHFDDVADVLALFRDDSLVAAPGARYSYSSPGYNLLAAAVQAAAGERFQDYVARPVIAPLGCATPGSTTCAASTRTARGATRTTTPTRSRRTPRGCSACRSGTTATTRAAGTCTPRPRTSRGSGARSPAPACSRGRRSTGSTRAARATRPAR
jgi:CubicO group peptidase (beta-lactamase class C family)